MSLVSCIVAVFNGERYLAETLDSLVAQTHRPIEVIVVDDGSTDRTAQIARTHHRELVYVHQPNAGHAAARNLGISVAGGDYVAFTDADDLWHPEKLARQLERFAARPELGAVFTHLENFGSGAAEASVHEETARPMPGYTSVTMLARRDGFARVGPLDVTLKHGNDRDWFCRAAEHGVAMELMADVLVRRRLHAFNRSTQLSEASRAEYLRIIKASLDRRRAAGGGGAVGGGVAEYPFHSHRAE